MVILIVGILLGKRCAQSNKAPPTPGGIARVGDVPANSVSVPMTTPGAAAQGNEVHRKTLPVPGENSHDYNAPENQRPPDRRGSGQVRV